MNNHEHFTIFLFFYDALHNSCLDAIFQSFHIRAIFPITKIFKNILEVF